VGDGDGLLERLKDGANRDPQGRHQHAQHKQGQATGQGQLGGGQRTHVGGAVLGGLLHPGGQLVQQGLGLVHGLLGRGHLLVGVGSRDDLAVDGALDHLGCGGLVVLEVGGDLRAVGALAAGLQLLQHRLRGADGLGPFLLVLLRLVDFVDAEQHVLFIAADVAHAHAQRGEPALGDELVFGEGAELVAELGHREAAQAADEDKGADGQQAEGDQAGADGEGVLHERGSVGGATMTLGERWRPCRIGVRPER